MLHSPQKKQHEKNQRHICSKFGHVENRIKKKYITH